MIGGKSDEISTLQTAEMLQVAGAATGFPGAPDLVNAAAAVGAPASAGGTLAELTVSGATVLHPGGEVRESVCNGEYAQAGTLHGRPIYRKLGEAGSGPAIFFDGIWKMSASGKAPYSFIFTQPNVHGADRMNDPWSDTWVTTSHWRLKSPPTVRPFN